MHNLFESHKHSLPKYLMIDVIDTGIGICKNGLKELFKPFGKLK